MCTTPHLVSISLEDDHPFFMLRAPHKHDGEVEILLVREGAGLHKKVSISGSGDFEEFMMISTLMYDNTLRNDNINAEIANYLLRIYLVKAHQAVLKQGMMPPPVDKNSYELGLAIKQYLDKHYCEETLTLKSVADAIHVSTYHMSHVFKSIYNLSPIQYVTHR